MIDVRSVQNQAGQNHEDLEVVAFAIPPKLRRPRESQNGTALGRRRLRRSLTLLSGDDPIFGGLRPLGIARLALNCEHEFAPDLEQLTMESAAPIIADADGKYSVPRPGINTKREYA